VQSHGLKEISSSMGRIIVWHYAKNITNIQNYTEFIHVLKPDLMELLKTRVLQGPIKFNLKLETTYSRPSVPNSSKNRAFKTSAVEIFMESDIADIIEREFMKIIGEEETYTSRGSGFTLNTIDGLLPCW